MWKRAEIRFPKNPETKAGQNETADNVDHMMLIRKDWRQRDQSEPNHDRNANETARVTKINIQQNQHECRVKGWKQIVRRVHATKPIEKPAEPSVSVRSRKREPQRKKQEADSSDYNCHRDALGEDRQLATCPTKKWRDNEEQIDGHVGENEKRNEGDLAFPFKIECADVRASRTDPVATAVNDQEKDRQSDGDDERFAPFNAHVLQLTR